MRKPIILIILIAFIFSCKNENQDERSRAIEYLHNVAKLTNETQKLPRKVNENTTIEEVIYDSGKNEMIYSIILTNFTPDIENKSEILSSLKENESNLIKLAQKNQGNDRAYQLLRVTIKSVYKDANEKEFYSFKINPEQYLQ